MIVVHVSGARGFRGGEQQALYLIDELRRRGLRQVLIARPGAPLHERVRQLGVEVVLAGTQWAAVRAVRAFAKTHSDAVGHAHDSRAHTTLWLAGLTGCSVAYVVSRRVLRSPGAPQTRWSKYAPGSLCALLCVSEAVAELHRERLGQRVPIEVVYDAVAIPAEAVPMTPGSTTVSAARGAPSGRLRAELGLAPEVRLVGTVAALAPEKDTATWVTACAAMARRRSDLHFVHVGGGSAAAELELGELVGAAGLGGVFHALGFRADATALVAEFDVFVFATRWEGFGSALLEAQIRGVPVVSTAAGGTVEVIADGVTGLLVPIGAAKVLAKAALSLVEDSAARRAMVARARRSAEGFSAARMAEATLAAYGSCGLTQG